MTAIIVIAVFCGFMLWLDRDTTPVRTPEEIEKARVAMEVITADVADMQFLKNLFPCDPLKKAFDLMLHLPSPDREAAMRDIIPLVRAKRLKTEAELVGTVRDYIKDAKADLEAKA